MTQTSEPVTLLLFSIGLVVVIGSQSKRKNSEGSDGNSKLRSRLFHPRTSCRLGRIAMNYTWLSKSSLLRLLLIGSTLEMGGRTPAQKVSTPAFLTKTPQSGAVGNCFIVLLPLVNGGTGAAKNAVVTSATGMPNSAWRNIARIVKASGVSA